MCYHHWAVSYDELIIRSTRSCELHEIIFKESIKSLQINKFYTFNLFNDGSFYLLNILDRATGHLAGLARTTPDIFIMMGGDLCHHDG
jgi:hypothetical protein